MARAIPLGRLQTAEQVAGAVAYLCSDAADYLTGSVLLADGGCSLRVVTDADMLDDPTFGGPLVFMLRGGC